MFRDIVGLYRAYAETKGLTHYTLEVMDDGSGGVYGPAVEWAMEWNGLDTAKAKLVRAMPDLWRAITERPDRDADALWQEFCRWSVAQHGAESMARLYISFGGEVWVEDDYPSGERVLHWASLSEAVASAPWPAIRGLA